MYVNDLQKRLTRHEQYWKKENHDRPLLCIHVKKNNVKPNTFKTHETIRDAWWDTDYIIRKARAEMENTYYAGDSFPSINPNLGPDIFAAFLGAELEYSESTSWAKHFVQSWEGMHFHFDDQNPYWQKIVEITEACLEDSHGDYLVGVTDIHQGMDCLVSLRGPENVCMDLYDCPNEIKRVLSEVEDVFRTVLYRCYSIIRTKQKGMTNWMGIYHPDSCYVSSSDFIYMVSPEMFDEFSAQSIQNEAKIIGNNIYHLDGVGSLTHLDKLLAMKEIHGIQWVYGAGKPTAGHWVDLLRKIQQAGKCIHIDCIPQDFPILFNSGLRPEGVLYTSTCETEDQAEQIIEDALRAYQK